MFGGSKSTHEILHLYRPAASSENEMLTSRHQRGLTVCEIPTSKSHSGGTVLGGGLPRVGGVERRLPWAWPVPCTMATPSNPGAGGTRAPMSGPPAQPGLQAQPCLCALLPAATSSVTHLGQTPNLEDLPFCWPAPAAAPGGLGRSHWPAGCTSAGRPRTPRRTLNSAWWSHPSSRLRSAGLLRLPVSLPWGCSLTSPTEAEERFCLAAH